MEALVELHGKIITMCYLVPILFTVVILVAISYVYCTTLPGIHSLKLPGLRNRRFRTRRNDTIRRLVLLARYARLGGIK